MCTQSYGPRFSSGSPFPSSVLIVLVKYFSRKTNVPLNLGSSVRNFVNLRILPPEVVLSLFKQFFLELSPFKKGEVLDYIDVLNCTLLSTFTSSTITQWHSLRNPNYA